MKIRIGTRQSKLALVQTYMVRDKILEAFPDAEVELVEMTTKGDRILDRALTSFGGKGVFTQELEDALLSGEVDLAVHSAKDMPMEFPEGLGIGAVLDRADIRDVLITTTGTKLKDMPAGSVIGTSSLRRELQVKKANPGVTFAMLRGNVQTRIRKLTEGNYDGILLAAAGLERLGMKEEDGLFFEYLDPTKILPAAGQGILAVESKNGHLTDVLKAIHSEKAEKLLMAERAFLTAIGGSCNAPAAGYSAYETAEVDGKETEGLAMRVFYAPDGKEGRRAEGFMPLTGEETMSDITAFAEKMAGEVKKGMVYLVGAGPGDPGLITRKALELIKKADVLVYDALISTSFLAEANDSAELIYAGKRSANHHLKQWETNALLIEKAKEGKIVVRLKGGDPFIFGRGGEEAQELLEAGIPFEIVPGISSSYSAAAYAGIPVTHRDYASSFHVITGHESNTKEGLVLDYETLAKEEGTLIFLMGLKNLPNITGQLMKYGKDPKTPAAVIQSGTTSRQRCVTGTVDTIVEIVEKEGIKTPAATVIGPVVGLRRQLDWFGKEPLFGARVLLTGTRSMCEKQVTVLKKLGADPIPFSLIRIENVDSEELQESLKNIKDYTWVVFTSSNGVDLFFAYLKDQKIDIRSLAGIKIAVIGEGTKNALTENGVLPDFVPSKYSSDDLAAEWIPTLGKDDKVLLLRAEEASKVLPKKLEEAGIAADARVLYHTAVDERKAEELNRILPEMDYVTFASSSAVKAFAGMLEEGTKLPKIICIGPVTAKTAVKCGFTEYLEATEFTAEGMKDIIQKDWEDRV